MAAPTSKASPQPDFPFCVLICFINSDGDRHRRVGKGMLITIDDYHILRILRSSGTNLLDCWDMTRDEILSVVNPIVGILHCPRMLIIALQNEEAEGEIEDLQ